MKTYMVKEIVSTVEGEGSLTGMPITLVRLTGCNQWSGRPEDRASSACPFCDTDFVGGQRMTVEDILAQVDTQWVSFTGGEPLLQLDADLLKPFQKEHHVKVETNGSISAKKVRHLIDVLALSPKVGTDRLKVWACSELKVLWRHPDPRIQPEVYVAFPAFYRYVQIITDDDGTLRDPEGAIAEAKRLGWRVGFQAHKFLGVR